MAQNVEGKTAIVTGAGSGISSTPRIITQQADRRKGSTSSSLDCCCKEGPMWFSRIWHSDQRPRNLSSGIKTRQIEPCSSEPTWCLGLISRTCSTWPKNSSTVSTLSAPELESLNLPGPTFGILLVRPSQATIEKEGGTSCSTST